MIAFIVAVLIVFLMMLIALIFNWVDLEVFNISKGFSSILKVAIPVAIIEELIFRILPILKFGFTPGVIIISSLVFALVHFFGGMYSNVEDAKEAVCLFFGLALLGFGCCFLYNAGNYMNIFFHAGCISGVSITQQLVTKSDNFLYSKGHKLIRSPIVWVLMTISFIILGKV